MAHCGNTAVSPRACISPYRGTYQTVSGWKGRSALPQWEAPGSGPMSNPLLWPRTRPKTSLARWGPSAGPEATDGERAGLGCGSSVSDWDAWQGASGEQSRRTLGGPRPGFHPTPPAKKGLPHPGPSSARMLGKEVQCGRKNSALGSPHWALGKAT